MHSRREKETTFSVVKVDYEPRKCITHLVTGKDALVMSLEEGSLVRLSLDAPSELEEIEVGAEPVTGMFLDPTGCHLLLVIKRRKTMYLHRSWKRPRSLKKLKGLNVTAVGWNDSGADSASTGLILLGTDTGEVYELEIEVKGGWSLTAPTLEKHFKWLYAFELEAESKQLLNPYASVQQQADAKRTEDTDHSAKKEASSYFFASTCTETTLQGIRWFTIRPSNGPPKIYVFLCSHRFLWSFVGFHSFEHLFLSPCRPDVREFPSPYFIYSKLELYYRTHLLTEEPHTEILVPQALAWLTFSGVFLMNLNVSETDFLSPSEPTSADAPSSKGPKTSPSFSLNVSNDPIFDSSRHIPLTCDSMSRQPYDDLILSIALTELYIVVLYAHGLFQFLDVSAEKANLWSVYLQKRQYALAAKHCTEPWQRERVSEALALHHFQSGLYELSAKAYATTNLGFEQIVLIVPTPPTTPTTHSDSSASTRTSRDAS
ncbi:vacuolar protein sorting-associated protein 18 homolog [Schistocerca gregaria]|uniref:vacuolar protein sorting-associated protein 18 homolog n=1 Tax=Schistocerca gregaria TaxID=7010 RepID=UPI00211EBC0A|nr:vacuolar protein sorting-associated protein 18 homolog [Schistocerca gregaria]